MDQEVYEGYETNLDSGRTPILKGCENKECLCTGKCHEIVGYIESYDSRTLCYEIQ